MYTWNNKTHTVWHILRIPGCWCTCFIHAHCGMVYGDSRVDSVSLYFLRVRSGAFSVFLSRLHPLHQSTDLTEFSWCTNSPTWISLKTVDFTLSLTSLSFVSCHASTVAWHAYYVHLRGVGRVQRNQQKIQKKTGYVCIKSIKYQYTFIHTCTRDMYHCTSLFDKYRITEVVLVLCLKFWLNC